MTQTKLRIADIGSFHVGGRQVRLEGQAPREIAFTRSTSFSYDPNGLHHVEQAYVQYFVPETVTAPLPIVLLHGGGFSGAMWESTPDGRWGWLQAFLCLGFRVYVVDSVERGRAGWCALPGVWEGAPVTRSAEEAWSLFRFGRAEDFGSRTPFEGQRFPVHALDTLSMGFVPRWLINGEAAVSAFQAVLQRVGPCCVIAHSQGAEVAFRAAASLPDLAPLLVALEPSGFPDDAASFQGRSVLVISGDYLDRAPLWSALMARTEAFGSGLQNAGATLSRWALPTMGMRGNSHMLMMDDNNADLAGMIARWITSGQGSGAPVQ